MPGFWSNPQNLPPFPARLRRCVNGQTQTQQSPVLSPAVTSGNVTVDPNLLPHHQPANPAKAPEGVTQSSWLCRTMSKRVGVGRRSLTNCPRTATHCHHAFVECSSSSRQTQRSLDQKELALTSLTSPRYSMTTFLRRDRLEKESAFSWEMIAGPSCTTTWSLTLEPLFSSYIFS